MRASTCATVSRLCVRAVCCWFAFPLVPALGSTGSATDRSALFASFVATTAWVRLPAFVHHRLSVLPSRCGPEAELPWPSAGSPKFRRDPFARDLLFDPGRRAWPRLAALPVLRSTLCTVSAPATYPLRGSITHPTQPLCTLRGRRRRRLTQHSLPGCLLGITWIGLSPTDRASFAWRLRRGGSF
jgi:hypothetical protein